MIELRRLRRDEMKAGVMELPLFPLNVVLFPGQSLPLHIFEPRYRVMIQRCIEQSQPFGVVLVDEDDDTTPHTIGTAARITQVERLPDGRMNILTVGVERFILENVYEGEDDYLIGNAVFYPFAEETQAPVELLNCVITRLHRYLTLLATLSAVKFKFDEFPTDSTALAVFAAIALQLPLPQKQLLLATESVKELLQEEAELLNTELLAFTIMNGSIRPPADADKFMFSNN
jgi:Lon protease-like protein